MTQAATIAAPHLVGASPAHVQLLQTLDRVSLIDVEVLITGPTGVGKELYAGYIHQHSLRANAPFVPVNCAALPPDLIENELFGHIGGAFTGARPQSTGLVAEAEGGTLFLDEVDSLPIGCQAKLLRFLNEKEYRRLGETRLRHANLRIVAATNSDLPAAIQAKTFRQDLFFRLRVVPVEVPALAQRREDIPPLIAEFSERYSDAYHLPRVVFGDRALARAMSYPWPGNIRELENCVKYLTCLQLTRPVDPYDLPLLDDDPRPEIPPLDVLVESGSLKDVKRDLVVQFERAYLENALRRSGGNIAAAARASGKPRRVFFELMRKHGVGESNTVRRPGGNQNVSTATTEGLS